MDSDPPLILTDKPTGNFNSQMALEVMDLLVEISHGDKTLVIVT
jgi:ABC-type lipoprotein export system ATPase subunit